MDNSNYTTEHRKGQHLLNEERYEIEVRLKDGWSIYKIAKYLGRAYNTIKDEVERGTVTLYNGNLSFSRITHNQKEKRYYFSNALAMFFLPDTIHPSWRHKADYVVISLTIEH